VPDEGDRQLLIAYECRPARLARAPRASGMPDQPSELPSLIPQGDIQHE
jgi:hypothetical protein